MTTDVRDKGVALVRLVDLGITPTANLVGFIMSAFKDDGQVNLEYATKYREAYSALLSVDNYMTVKSRISKEGKEECPVSKLDLLRKTLIEASFVPTEGDLATLIERMEFSAVPMGDAGEDTFGVTSDVIEEASNDARVAAVRASVINAYKELYRSVFSPLHPQGAYSTNVAGYPNGGIKHNTAHNKENMKNRAKGTDSVVTPSSYAVLVIRAVYRLLGLESLVDTGSVGAEELGNTNRHYYFSRQHGRIASGVLQNGTPRYTKWSEFEEHLVKWVDGKLSDVYKAYNKIDANADFDAQMAQTKEVEEALRAAGSSLATAVVVEVCDPKTANLLVLRVCAPRVLSGEVDKEGMAHYISKAWNAMALRDITYVQNDPTMDYCVYTITIALNSKLERSAPMYAFQVWEDLENVGDITELLGTHNIMFGRNSDGSLNAYNMKTLTSAPHNTSVVAASQSGKGLTTLAAVAATAANRQPVFYMDGKPDMALAFWNYLSTHPNPDYRGRTFAFDGIDYSATPVVASADVQKYNHGQAPDEIPDMGSSQRGGLILAKTLSLMLAIMKTTSSGASVSGVGKVLGYDFTRGGLFVFDEVQKLDAQAWAPLAELVALDKDKAFSGDSPDNVYLKKLKSYLKDLLGEVYGYNKALSKKTHISMFTLFQNIDYADKSSTFVNMFGTKTFIGRVASSLQYVNKIASTPEAKLAFENYQWFDYNKDIVAVRSGFNAGEPLKSPIKPFLLFNDEKNLDGYCDGETYMGLDSSIKALVENERTKGDKNRLHIAGLLNYYGVDLADSLVLGHDIAQNFLRLIGFQGSVSDYVLSAHVDTLISYKEMCDRAFAAVKENPDIELPALGTSECLYSQGEAGSAGSLEINDGDMADDFDFIGNTEATDYDFQTEYAPEETVDEVLDRVDNHSDFLTTAVDSDESLYTELEPTPYKEVEVETNPFEEQVVEANPFAETETNSYTDPELEVNPFAGQQTQQTSEPDSNKHTKQSKPYFYIYGMPFIQGDDGNFYFATGPYAPLHNVEHSVFAGEQRSNAAVTEQYGPPKPFTEGVHGIAIDDQEALRYGQRFIGAEVSNKRKLRPISTEMTDAKFEKAISERWYILMKAISKSVGGARAVGHLTILENIIYVNGSPLAASYSLVAGTGLRITDLVDYPALFKHFKELRRLDLGKVAYTSFCAAYTKPSTPFKKNKNLQEIKFEMTDGKIESYTRECASKDLGIPVDRVGSQFNTWTAMSAQVNKGSTSSFTRPGTRLIMADFTKQMKDGVFGTNSEWSGRRKALGLFGLVLGVGGTVLTGGVQAARASRANHQRK